MPRYIDADALKAKYEQMIPEIGDGYHKETLQDVLFELDYAPTVSPDDVRGVGEWIVTTDRFAPELTCSNCNATFPAIAGCCLDAKINYCPSCGARMKGGAD